MNKSFEIEKITYDWSFGTVSDPESICYAENCLYIGYSDGKDGISWKLVCIESIKFEKNDIWEKDPNPPLKINPKIEF